MPTLEFSNEGTQVKLEHTSSILNYLSFREPSLLLESGSVLLFFVSVIVVVATISKLHTISTFGIKCATFGIKCKVNGQK